MQYFAKKKCPFLRTNHSGSLPWIELQKWMCCVNDFFFGVKKPKFHITLNQVDAATALHKQVRRKYPRGGEEERVLCFLFKCVMHDIPLIKEANGSVILVLV